MKPNLPIMRRLLTALVVVTLIAGTVAGCTEERPVPAHIVRVVADFSDSALAENGSDLNAAALHVVTEIADGAAPGTTIEIVGFSNRPGQECDPIVLALPKQKSGEGDQQLRENVSAELPAAWKRYEACLRDPRTGMPHAGSGIFGATVLASTTDTDSLSSVIVVSDGCTWGELAPAPETCSSEVLDRPAGPQKLVDDMPAALKPPIGVPITFVHLGRGTGLNAQQLLALRSTYALWGTATGTRITFEN